MKTNDGLFELVMALTPAEKRYFKVNARRYAALGKSNYLKLFDALCKIPLGTYSETLFKKQHKGKSFIKNLAYEKFYLRDLLLKTMRNYRSSKPGQATIQELITDLEFMAERGLSYGAIRLLETAWQKAEEMELFPEMLTILHFRRRLLWQGANVDHFNYKEHMLQEKSVLQHLEVLQECTHLLMVVEDINRSDTWQLHNAQINTTLKRISELELAGNLSQRARYNLLSTKTLIYFKRAQFQSAYSLLKDYIVQLEENRNLHFLRSRTYYGVLSNLLYTAMLLEDYSLFPSVLEKLNQVLPLNEQERMDLFLIRNRYEAIYMLNTGNFAQAESLQQKTIEGLTSFEADMRKADKLASLFNLVLISFFTRNHDRTIGNLNRLFAIAGNDKKQAELLIIARFIELMCHADLKNIDLVISYHRNLLRQIKLYASYNQELKHLTAIILSKCTANLANEERDWLMHFNDSQLLPQWAQLFGLVRFWCN